MRRASVGRGIDGVDGVTAACGAMGAGAAAAVACARRASVAVARWGVAVEDEGDCEGVISDGDGVVSEGRVTGGR